MKVNQIISQTDKMRPNGIDDKQKITWLDNLEKELYERIIKKFETEIEYKKLESSNDEVMLEDNFIELYVNYLVGKVDYMLCEYDRYNNDVAIYRQSYSDFCAWFRENNNHKITKFLV